MSEVKKYLNSLEIAEPLTTNRFDQRNIFYEGLEATTDEDQAAINYKSVQSFVAGLSAERQEDVLNSLLLAQRAATKAYPDENDMMLWYKKYFEVLSMVGWVFENKGFQTFNTKNNSFEIDKVLIEILSTALTGNQVALILKSFEALKSLGDDDKRFQAFERNTHSLTRGNFQLGLASEENGTLSMSSFAFVLTTKKIMTKILFFRSEKDATQLDYCDIKATLINSKYADAREEIRAKLGDTRAYVADLEI